MQLIHDFWSITTSCRLVPKSETVLLYVWSLCFIVSTVCFFFVGLAGVVYSAMWRHTAVAVKEVVLFNSIILLLIDSIIIVAQSARSWKMSSIRSDARSFEQRRGNWCVCDHTPMSCSCLASVSHRSPSYEYSDLLFLKNDFITFFEHRFASYVRKARSISGWHRNLDRCRQTSRFVCYAASPPASTIYISRYIPSVSPIVVRLAIDCCASMHRMWCIVIWRHAMYCSAKATCLNSATLVKKKPRHSLVGWFSFLNWRVVVVAIRFGSNCRYDCRPTSDRHCLWVINYIDVILFIKQNKTSIKSAVEMDGSWTSKVICTFLISTKTYISLLFFNAIVECANSILLDGNENHPRWSIILKIFANL